VLHGDVGIDASAGHAANGQCPSKKRTLGSLRGGQEDNRGRRQFPQAPDGGSVEDRADGVLPTREARRRLGGTLGGTVMADMGHGCGSLIEDVGSAALLAGACDTASLRALRGMLEEFMAALAPEDASDRADVPICLHPLQGLAEDRSWGQPRSLARSREGPWPNDSPPRKASTCSSSCRRTRSSSTRPCSSASPSLKADGAGRHARKAPSLLSPRLA
jgi:hypothetical protein